jgi:UDP:flavonoid glycosyltransferase YjiC (YdhE family)
MKIILAPEGTEGDLRPVLAVGIGLKVAGHAVEACVPPDFIEYFAGRGIKSHPMSLPVKQFMQMHGAMMVGKTVGTFRPMIENFAVVVRGQFACLEEYAAGADLIVGAGLQFAGGSVAQKLGIAYRHLVHVPVIAPSSWYPPPITRHLRLPRFVNAGMWELYQAAMNLLLKKPMMRERRRLGLPPVGNVVRFFLENMVLAMDPELTAWPPDLGGVPLFHTAYPQLVNKSELDAGLLRFIEAGPAPVYVGFGSMPDPRPQKTWEIVRGAVAAAGVRAVISRGWSAAGAAMEQESNIFPIDYAPHGRLFPRMAAAVHHGGAGTLHSCALAGVPQVIVPHILDQYYWAQRVHSLRLGPLPVNRGRLSVPALASAIRSAIDTSEYAENSKALSRILQQRNGAAETIRLLEKALN